MLGMTGDMTGDNFDQYEGARGICPEGWHIPTMAEWLKLAGVGSGNLTDPTSPYFEQTQSGGSIVKLNKDGFNIAGCGYVNAANVTATPGLYGDSLGCRRLGVRHGVFPQFDRL